MAAVPRAFFELAGSLGLSGSEIDFALKLMAFGIDGEIRPSISEMANRSGLDEKTYRRAANGLENKNYIQKKQRRGESGRLGTNDYDLSALWQALADRIVENRNGQLSLFSFLSLDAGKESLEKVRGLLSRFGPESDTVLSRGFVFVPRAIDTHQKEIGMNAFENVFAKYLFAYSDDSGVSSVSLATASKHLGISRTTFAKAVAGMESKGLVIVRASIGRSRRKANRYDLNPLVRKLELLEQAKVKQQLQEEGKWTDYQKIRKQKRNTGINIPHMPHAEAGKRKDPRESAIAIDRKIADIRSRTGYVVKGSEEAAEIRALEEERSSLVSGTSGPTSLATILLERMAAMRITTNQRDPLAEKASQICSKIGGNWSKNRRFYIKAVSRLESTVERYVAAASELATSSSERYFIKCAAAAMRELENSTP